MPTLSTDSSTQSVTDKPNGHSLLANLNSDIEMYHQKVELKEQVGAETPVKSADTAMAAEEKQSAESITVTEPVQEPSPDSVSDSIKRTPADPQEGPEDRRPETPEVSELGTELAAVLGDKRAAESPESGDGDDQHHRKRRGHTVPWTQEEDEAIVYYKEVVKYSWKKIESLLKHRHSWQAIQMRYLRNHKSRNEEWSRYMEIKLINLVRKDWENRWKRISKELGRDFSAERCVNKNVELCKRLELPYVESVFKNKEITDGYDSPYHDIKDAEQHKKLLLVYMGLDSISYEDDDDKAADAAAAAAQPPA